LTDEVLDFHSFQAGLIVRSYDDHVFVGVCEGLQGFSQILDEDGETALNLAHLGRRFHAPCEQREAHLYFSFIQNATTTTIR
jgi:hypothetical protein